MSGLIAEKLGMTQVYDKEGNFVPVTVLRVLPNVVTGVRSQDKNGYCAVQMGYDEKKAHRLTKPAAGFFKKNGLKPAKVLKEFRTARGTEYKIGQAVDISVLAPGDIVKVQGISKGKGFQGVMKRWHFAGGTDSHGNSVSHRAPGSIGQRTSPGRVFALKKLPGHMGDRTISVKNLDVIAVEAEQNLVLIRGSVPGPNSARVLIYPQATKVFEDRVLAKMKDVGN
jgi:large subunit ribosomal protein L3